MPTTLEAVVMRRVRIVYALRPLLGHGAVALLTLAVSLVAIGREVWVAKVFANMPSLLDVLAVVRFLGSALMSTEPSVQILSVLVAASCVLVMHALAQAVRGLTAPRFV